MYRGNLILCASLQVGQLLTGCITQDIKASLHTFTPRHLIDHDTGEGLRGGRKETVTLYQPPRDTNTAQYWVLATMYCSDR